MTRILLRDVEKRYGETLVLQDCNLAIHDGEFMVLVGPSGSGKTTLLRLIAGLEHITAGDLFFDGERVNDIDVGDRDIAMVFQNYGLYPHMSVYDNMAFGLRRRKMARAEIDRRVSRAADLLNIVPYLARRPRQLSGGQRQRVALGRAIVRDPKVFLLDEPLSNLDAHLRAQMRSEILKVHRAVAATAVYVTHDQIEALTMGDRIVVMSDGRIQQVGTPDELYDCPANRFVASFIGTPSMGFLTGRVVEGAAEVKLASGHLRLSPEQAALVRPLAGRDVAGGIRPERLSALPEGECGRDVVATGTVESVELLGAEQHVAVRTPDGILTARISREHHLRFGETLTLGADARFLHLFDAGTGLRLGATASTP